jgi:hypothetical protein
LEPENDFPIEQNPPQDAILSTLEFKKTKPIITKIFPENKHEGEKRKTIKNIKAIHSQSQR